jgi:DNA modification methylase
MIISKEQYNKLPKHLQDFFEPTKNTHPTVKSINLMRYLCRLITPPGGLILDPFAGSGSTGVAATNEGFESILIELEHASCETARMRNGLH